MDRCKSPQGGREIETEVGTEYIGTSLINPVVSKFLLSILCLFVATLSFSQDYVITLKSDTLKGDVKLLSYDLMDRVQLTHDKKKTTYTALQVRRASIKGEQFAPVKYDNAIRMMKVMSAGFLSLYGHRIQGQANYDTKILVKTGANTIEVPNIGFKRFVGDMVEDCPAVSDRVKNGDFDRNNVVEMVDAYNDCIKDANERRLQSSRENSPTADLIEQMKTKVSASDLANKSEVNDLLNSIAEKLKKKESVPSYMKEGLKGYIGSREDLKGDMEQLFTMIDQ